MALASGTRLGPYEVQSALGAGGMGEKVYRARDTRLSADMRWVAYTSNESGRDDVYVQPFPSLAGKWQVSPNGGDQAVWSRDGRSLFYRGEGHIMAVDMTVGTPPQPGVPHQVLQDVFETKGRNHIGYDVAPGGKRFLFVRDSDRATVDRHCSVVEHFLPELRRRVAIK